MMLNTSWNFSWFRIGWYCSFLWSTGWALTFFPSYDFVCVWLHYQTRIPYFPLPNFHWIVDVSAWIFRWISRVIFSWWYPQILFYFWMGISCEYIQVWKSFLFFGFTVFGVLDFLLNHMHGSCRGSAWIWCACWTCFPVSELGLNHLCLFPFVIWFAWIPCPFFSSFVWVYPFVGTRILLLGPFFFNTVLSSDLRNVNWCGRGCSNIDS